MQKERDRGMSKFSSTKNKHNRALEFCRPLESGRLYVALIFILVSVLLFWSSNSEISRIVRVEGKIVPAGKSQKIAHLEGGILSDIYIQEGDFVRKGDRLLAIDNTQAGANLSETNVKIIAQKARVVRLKAEAEGLAALAFDDGIKNSEASKAEIDLFNARQNKLASEVNVGQSMLNQRLAELQELKQKGDRLNIELNTALERYQIVKKMSDSGAASKLELIDAKSREQNLRSQIGDILSAVPKVKAGIAEAENRIKESKSTFSAEAQAEYVAVSAEIDRLQQVAKSANDRLQRTEITAPVDGIVNSISINTLGGIVKPGEILVELTPVTDKIVIEAKAAPSDRGFIHPGLPVQVRMNSYEVSEYGILNGKITKVGSDSTQDTRGQPFYQVNIAVDSLTPLFKGKEIVPGMVVTADIVTGKRTILKYLLSPLTKFTYNIFKDPK